MKNGQVNSQSWLLKEDVYYVNMNSLVVDWAHRLALIGRTRFLSPRPAGICAASEDAQPLPETNYRPYNTLLIISRRVV